jgi:hypothetical protein
MRNHLSSRPRTQRSMLPPVVCEHKFEVAKVGKRFIPGLLVCQDCGQRVRKRLPKTEMNS